MDLCIIGGGASGMTAAIKAKTVNPKLNILIIEKKEKLGSKLFATGNGKCNISNESCPDIDEVIDFLNSVGIYTRKEDEGRLYPISEQAKDVVNALTDRLENLGIHILTTAEVVSISKEKDEFTILYNANGIKNHISCRCVLIAAGGKAAPEFGTTGDGYRFSKILGHNITKLAPSLTPVHITPRKPEYKGIRAKVLLQLTDKDKIIAREEGMLQFTEKGLSGICIFNISRKIDIGREKTFSDYSIKVDYLPDMNLSEVEEMLCSKAKIKGHKTGSLLQSVIDQRLANDILFGYKNNKPIVNQLTLEELREISKQIKCMEFKIEGTGGWKEAQCTRGGVDLAEINMSTMESRICKGLYFSGEVIDYDGPCGGYNLHNAWKTGIIVGKAVAKEI